MPTEASDTDDQSAALDEYLDVQSDGESGGDAKTYPKVHLLAGTTNSAADEAPSRRTRRSTITRVDSGDMLVEDDPEIVIDPATNVGPAIIPLGESLRLGRYTMPVAGSSVVPAELRALRKSLADTPASNCGVYGSIKLSHHRCVSPLFPFTGSL